MCVSIQGSLYPSPMNIHQTMQIQWLFSKKIDQKINDQNDPYDLQPHVPQGHMCNCTQGLLCPTPIKMHHCMGIQRPFFQKTKGHWSLDGLWPHFCSGRMRDSTQGSLCLRVMGIHQCTWIQWLILQKYHILHTLTICILSYVCMYVCKLLNKSFRIVDLRTWNSMFTSHSLGENEGCQRIAIYFCTFWQLIYWNQLTNASDMVISKLVDQVLHPLQQPILSVCFLWLPKSNLQLGNVNDQGDK